MSYIFLKTIAHRVILSLYLRVESIGRSFFRDRSANVVAETPTRSGGWHFIVKEMLNTPHPSRNLSEYCTMNAKWNFPFHRVLLLYFCGILLGGEVALLVTKNVSITAGFLEIVSMILVSILLVRTSHVRDVAK